jgi:hypothetical protein
MPVREVGNTMRICRVMGTYPTDIRPGMGLPEYYMFVHMADPSLGIGRRRHPLGRLFQRQGREEWCDDQHREGRQHL